MTNRSTTDKIQKDPFELALPEVFDIKPVHVVSLPAKREARIYSTLVETCSHIDGKQVYVDKPGWRVMIYNRHGRPVYEDRYSRSEFGRTFSDPLVLALHLQHLVAEYSKTKRTTVEDNEIED